MEELVVTDFIAERVVEARDATGKGLTFRFAIEAPKRIDDGSWGCGLLMEGMTGQPNHRVVGQDAWQSLTLAVRLVEQLLIYFVEDGGRLFWEGSDIPIAVSDVVPRTSTNGPKPADLI
jgi:hypothetical protein